MQLLFLTLLMQMGSSWKPMTSFRKIDSNVNDNNIYQDDYIIIAQSDYTISYQALQSYRKLHISFDAKSNITQCELLIKVNGIRRNILLIDNEFSEFHMEFEHQAPQIKIQFLFEQKKWLYVRNFNLFFDECPKNCMYCLSGQCDILSQTTCEKLLYQNQCIEECPEGTIAENRECIQAKLNQIEQVQTFLYNGLKTTQKFGEEKVMFLNFEKEFKGILEIIFNCYGKQQLHYNSILKIQDNYGNSYTIHPFLQSYYNLQYSKKCQSEYDLDCTQVKGLFKLNFKKNNEIKISSYIKNDQDNTYWQIQNIKIYDKEEITYNCLINKCNKCTYNNYCEQCQDSYYLYQNQCIQQCPFYTQQKDGICKNIDEIQQEIKLLVKLESPFDDIQSIFGVKTFDMKENINFRYENLTTFIGGGLLDSWRRTTFSKQLNLGKHYAIRLMFNISIKDSNQDLDCFTYTIDGKTFSVYKNVSFIDHTLYHNKNILNMNLGCKISSDGRCIVSNYYFMVMKCSPLCQSCSGPSKQDCKQYQRNIVKFDYEKLDCIDGYFLSDNGCDRCSIGCYKCSTYSKCLQCKDTKEAEFNCKPYL